MKWIYKFFAGIIIIKTVKYHQIYCHLNTNKWISCYIDVTIISSNKRFPHSPCLSVGPKVSLPSFHQPLLLYQQLNQLFDDLKSADLRLPFVTQNAANAGTVGPVALGLLAFLAFRGVYLWLLNVLLIVYLIRGARALHKHINQQVSLVIEHIRYAIQDYFVSWTSRWILKYLLTLFEIGFNFPPITRPTLPTFDLLTILCLSTCVSLFLSQGSPPHPTGLNSSTFLILNCPSSLVNISVQIFKICLTENHWVYSHNFFCYSSSKYYLVFCLQRKTELDAGSVCMTTNIHCWLSFRWGVKLEVWRLQTPFLGN